MSGSLDKLDGEKVMMKPCFFLSSLLSIYTIQSMETEYKPDEQAKMLYGFQTKVLTNSHYKGILCSKLSNPTRYIITVKVTNRYKRESSAPVIIDTKKGTEITRSFQDTGQVINSLSTNHNGTEILAGTSFVIPFGCRYVAELGTIDAWFGDQDRNQWTTHMVLSPDEKEVWFITQKGLLRFDVNSNKYIGLFDKNYRAISPDRSMGVVCKEKGTLEFYDIVKDKLIQHIKTSNDDVNLDQLSISPDNQYFTAFNGSKLSKHIVVGSLINGTYKELELNDQPGCAIFNPDSSRIAYAMIDDTSTELPIIDMSGAIIKILKTVPGEAVRNGSGITWNDECLATFLMHEETNSIQMWENPLSKTEKTESFKCEIS